jgi:hypothetical protein
LPHDQHFAMFTTPYWLGLFPDIDHAAAAFADAL